MAILKSKTLILTLFLLSTLTFAIRSPVPVATPSDELSQLLVDHGLPSGLFPGTVNHVAAKNDGSMTVSLKEDCRIRLKTGELLHYMDTITAVIKQGIMSQIIGVQLQQGGRWRSVTVMQNNVTSNEMLFKSGLVTLVNLPMKNFYDPLQCLDSLILSTLTFAIRSPVPVATPSDELSQLLVDHGLPSGLFPGTVNHVAAKNDGSMTVSLKEDCRTHLKTGELLHYMDTITAVIKQGIMSQIIGVLLHQGGRWRSVTVMQNNVTSNEILFKCGLVTLVNLPMKNFYDPLQCLDSLNDWTSKIRSVTDAEM